MSGSRGVAVARGLSLFGLSLFAAACGGGRSPQSDGGSNAGTTGTAGASGTTGVAGTTGTTGTGGIAGTTGTGGIAGTTGSAGTTGVGGSAMDASSDDTAEPFDASSTCPQPFQRPGAEWTFGFQPAITSPITFTAVVSEVGADHLVLAGDGGASVTFRWAGPSLASEFSVSETVSCEKTADAWHVVKGTRRTARMHVEISNTGIYTSVAIPGGGSYTLEPECADVSAPTCPGGSPVVHTYYRVLAALGGDTATIPMRATVALGAAQITNVFHDEGSGGGLGQCHIDFSNVGLLSILGPP